MVWELDKRKETEEEALITDQKVYNEIEGDIEAMLTTNGFAISIGHLSDTIPLANTIEYCIVIKKAYVTTKRRGEN